MVKTKDILHFLEDYAPVRMKMDFDNVGLLVGKSEKEVNKILVSLDITQEVIEEAVQAGAGLIVSHHPLFFSLKTVNDTDITGRKILKLINHDIAAICMHTNLDAAHGGGNDVLAAKVGLTNTEILSEEGVNERGETYGFGRIGVLEDEVSFDSFLVYLKDILDSNGIRYYNAGRPVKKVAVLGGSGGSSLKDAVDKGCDTFITADIKYDVFLDAKEYGINLIDGDHFCTENVVVPVLYKKLKENFHNVKVMISESHIQTANFI